MLRLVTIHWTLPELSQMMLAAGESSQSTIAGGAKGLQGRL